MAYKKYKDNSTGKGILGGILGALLLFGVVAGGMAIANSIEDNPTQEVENEKETEKEEVEVEQETETETETETEVAE